MNRLFSFFFVACLLLTGCAHPAGGDWREYKVFCGMSYGNEAVSDTDWERFCDEYVTAEFPDGYTSLRATGHWKSTAAPATMREDSRILVILAPASAKENVLQIAKQYRRLFHQEAVLVTTSSADAEFIDSASCDEKQLCRRAGDNQEDERKMRNTQ